LATRRVTHSTGAGPAPPRSEAPGVPRALRSLRRTRCTVQGLGPAELRELIDADLPADELERLARVDALLRVAAFRVHDPDRAPSLVPRATCRDGARQIGRSAQKRAGRVPAKHRSGTDNPSAEVDSHGDAERMDRIHYREPRTGEVAVRLSSSLVTTPPAATGSTPHRTDEQTHELRLSFAELALIYRSLQAAKTLGALPPQDELLDDTIQLVDQALNRAT
jgi:hypothetical protein